VHAGPAQQTLTKKQTHPVYELITHTYDCRSTGCGVDGSHEQEKTGDERRILYPLMSNL